MSVTGEMVSSNPSEPTSVYPFRHMPRAADTTAFAVSEWLAQRDTLIGTGAGQLVPVFCSAAESVG